LQDLRCLSPAPALCVLTSVSMTSTAWSSAASNSCAGLSFAPALPAGDSTASLTPAGEAAAGEPSAAPAPLLVRCMLLVPAAGGLPSSSAVAGCSSFRALMLSTQPAASVAAALGCWWWCRPLWCARPDMLLSGALKLGWAKILWELWGSWLTHTPALGTCSSSEGPSCCRRCTIATVLVYLFDLLSGAVVNYSRCKTFAESWEQPCRQGKDNHRHVLLLDDHARMLVASCRQMRCHAVCGASRPAVNCSVHVNLGRC
jgi:hypothetical protein